LADFFAAFGAEQFEWFNVGCYDFFEAIEFGGLACLGYDGGEGLGFFAD
jgi:hypothetical protein